MSPRRGDGAMKIEMILILDLCIYIVFRVVSRGVAKLGVRGSTALFHPGRWRGPRPGCGSRTPAPPGRSRKAIRYIRLGLLIERGGLLLLSMHEDADGCAARAVCALKSCVEKRVRVRVAG